MLDTRRRTLHTLSLVAGVGIAAAAAVAQGPQITGIDALDGEDSVSAGAISADGTTVVGVSGTRAFRWTAGTGTAALSGMEGFSSARAYGVSADGSAIVGTGSLGGLDRGFRWTAMGGVEVLGPGQSSLNSSARGISADGAVVVGMGEATVMGIPMRFAQGWVSAGVPDRHYGGMDPFTDNHLAMASAASADGSVVVGSSALNRAFRWSGPSGTVELIPSGLASEATGVSADGSRVVGRYRDVPGSFVWTVGVGEVELGTLPSAEGTIARAISADGTTVVGRSSGGVGGGSAFLWTETMGIVELQSYLVSLGADLTGWALHDAVGVSGDGQTITGVGTFEGTQRSWVVTIPGPGGVGVVGAAALVAVRRRRREVRASRRARPQPPT